LGNTSVNKIDKSECKKSMKAQQKVYETHKKIGTKAHYNDRYVSG